MKNGQMGVKQHIVQVHVANGELQIFRGKVQTNAKTPSEDAQEASMTTVSKDDSPASQAQIPSKKTTKTKKRKAEQGEKDKEPVKKRIIKENSVDKSSVFQESPSTGNSPKDSVETLVDEIIELAPERSQFNLDDTVTTPLPTDDEDDSDFLPPDQDHHYIFEDEQRKVDIGLLNAKLTSLEAEMKSLKNTIVGKDIDLR